MDSRSPLARVAGAALRAGVMALAVALPQLVLGGGSEAGRQVVALFALLAFAFTALEYASPSPSLVEFRDAPPFNRLRAAALLLALLGVSALLREGTGASTGASTGERLLRALAGRLGEALDRPFLPVGLLTAALADGLEPARAGALRAAAGLACLVSLGAAGTFALLLRRGGWPTARAFNLWVNLPQFDPTAGGDVVARLEGQANLNLLLGALLPFVAPVAAGLLSDLLGGALLAEPTAAAWLVTLWALLPASLLMRGLALRRVAGLIAAQRRRADGPGALQPA